MTGIGPIQSSTSAVRRELADFMTRRRPEILLLLLDSLSGIPRWAASIEAAREKSIDDFMRDELDVFVDYLSKYFASADPAYFFLYIGEKIKQLYAKNADLEEITAQRTRQLEREQEALLKLASQSLSSEAQQALKLTLEQISEILTRRPRKTLRVLLVGDCLFLDILPFAVGTLFESGIELVPEYATAKSIGELKEQILSHADQQIDLIFVSPFTYEFDPDYAQLLNWRQALLHPGRAAEIASSACTRFEPVIDLVGDIFDCPVYVHNAANIIRESSAWKRAVKLLLTSAARRRAGATVDRWLNQYLKRKNEESFEHFFVVDEVALVKRHGAFHLGRLFHDSRLQHPAFFGKAMAEIYSDIIHVRAWLAGKKVIVCDLDNTLWQGVIGEGPVTHYLDRQSVLKELRRKGILLTVNSKNDPDRIDWQGAALSEDDFAYTDINWEPKVNGIRRTQEFLNLGVKDFVFVDDRADERELISMAFPELCCADAESPGVWRQFRVWADSLVENTEMDRTRMYRERQARKSFIRSEVQSEGGFSAADEQQLKALQLSLEICKPGKSELKRAAELINRTNQFNLCGSRVSFRQMREWSLSEDYNIFLGQTSDRFGDMGVTCVAVLRQRAQYIEIQDFVLSCRVFGFGIETAMMNHIKRLALSRPGASSLVGSYTETSRNNPCKNFYRDHGFQEENGSWLFNQHGDIQDPRWLTIQCV